MVLKVSRLALAVGLALGLSVAWGGAPRAATLTVTDLGDNGSAGQLRTLMNLAAAGDTIVIPAGTITLTGPANEDANLGGDLDVLKNLTIQGAGAGVTIIDGNANDGVFDILTPHTLTLSGVTIQNGINSAQAGGGAIRNFGTLTLANAIVSGNEAARTTAGDRNNGGGIRNLGTMTLTNVVIAGNRARGDGGGIYNEQNAVMTLTDVTVSLNRADFSGGGIYNFGTAILTKVTVSGNNADSTGGGIFTGGALVTAATATLTNVTVSANHAGAFGGGIYNSATAILTNVTVSGNSTAIIAAGGLANFGSATLKNVILAGNGDNCSGTITSLGNNLDSGATCGFGASDLSNTDPLLGALQDNGGPTFTQALLPGSPAIDAGAPTGCPPTDQRGFARPQGPACDIGAYEANAAPHVNHAPVLSPLVNLVVNEGQVVNLALLASDPDGTAALTLSAANLPPFAPFTDLGNGQGTIVFSPDFTQAGSYPGIAVTVADHDPLNPLSDTQTFDLTVNNTNRPPVLQPILNQALAENAPLEVPVVATDPDGNGTLVLTLENAPPFVTLTDNGSGQGILHLAPGFNDAGTYLAVAVRVNDQDPGAPLQDVQGFTVTVGNLNRPPQVTPLPDQTVAVGSTLDLPVTATDPDGTGSLTLSLLGAPAFVSLTDLGNGTGTLHLAPGPGSVATYLNVTVQADDHDPALPLQGSASFTLTVTKAPSTTTFTSPAPATLPFGGTYTPAASSTGDGTLTLDAGGACAIAGGVVTITAGSGTCTVTATESEGPSFLGSSATPQSIAATKADATVTVNSVSVAFDGLPHSASGTTTPDGLAVSFTYDGSLTPPTQVGTYAVVGTIDNPNYQGSGNGTLSITTDCSTLSTQVTSLSLNGGNKNSLISKLQAAQASLNRGNRGAAVNQLGAFINEVLALQKSGRLDKATADSLIAQATFLITEYR